MTLKVPDVLVANLWVDSNEQNLYLVAVLAV